MKPGWHRQLLSFSLPFTAIILVPYVLLAGGGARDWPAGGMRVAAMSAGLALATAGLGILAWTIRTFISIGRGTLAPWDPTRKLIIGGIYAHVRNPMISGVLLVLLGESLWFSSWHLLVWAGAFFMINHVYFVASEEPGLHKRFGAEYIEYQRHVPRWVPRRTPWRPGP